jgi:hypothetical protein
VTARVVRAGLPRKKKVVPMVSMERTGIEPVTSGLQNRNRALG